MGDEGPGDLGEFASDSVEGSGLGQALGLLASVAGGKGAVACAAGRGEGGDVEEAAEFGIAVLGEAKLAFPLAGLVHPDVEAEVGDELVRVGELFLDEAGC